MADRRAEVVGRWIEHTPDGDWVSALRDEARLGRMRAFLEEAAVADLEIVGLGGGPGAGGLIPTSRGADGFIAFWLDWLEPWESFTLELERIVPGPDGIVVEAVQQGRLRGSTNLVESQAAAVHFFRGDRLARIEFHLDRAEARQAAGLS